MELASRGAGAVEPEAELDTRELEQVGARVGVVEHVGLSRTVTADNSRA